MEASILRHFLENLCTHSQWSYAVFWRLEQLDTLMVLTCEDEYCDTKKSEHEPCPIILCEFNTRQEASENSRLETNNGHAHSLRHPIGSAVANMSCCHYFLGEGMVGKVALDERCLWIYSDDIESTELISKFEHENEWLLPIAAGIKTTLLVPVLPFGVVQLGSFHKVVESHTITAGIRDLFFNLAGKLSNTPFNYGNSLYGCPALVIPELGDSDDPSLGCTRLKYDDLDINHNIDFIDDYVECSHQLVPFMFENRLDELEDLSGLIDDQDKLGSYIDTKVEPYAPNTNGIPDASELLMISCHQEEFYDTSELLRDLYGEITDLISEQVEYQPLDGIDWNNIRNNKGVSTDHDLQKAFVPTFNESNERHSWNTFKESKYIDECLGFLSMENFGLVKEDIEQIYSLEDMVVDSHENSDSSVSDQCINASSISSLTEKCLKSDQDQCNTGLEYQTMVFRTPTSPPSFESIESVIAEDEEQQDCIYELVHKKPKISKNNFNEEKPKNNCRPRPRDRQLIQDRLKELRNLVPEGAKCSIDGLLDHTRKHMMFLKNAIEQADKVKQFTEQKIWNGCLVSSYKFQKYLWSSYVADFAKATFEKNEKRYQTSLPLEVGSTKEACPIIVKDLEHSSQFLIQMVCNDEGVFFEMAEVMHKLKLTILKGAIENRCHKWACFIVEASNGFNRLDIFWPLMRILHQNGNWMKD